MLRRFRRADAASREISEWVRSLGIKDPSKTVRYKPNHSFRHYCKTEWRNARVEEELHDAITGHGSDSESRQYGEYQLRLMLEAIKKLPNPFAEVCPVPVRMRFRTDRLHARGGIFPKS
jgi:integrase